LLPIFSILANILEGSAYCFTSIHNNHPRSGKTNIETTVMIIPIIAYLIVLIAGLILSSFQPERIRSNPHHNIKRIESIPATKTKIEIIVRIKSPGSIFGPNNGLTSVLIAAFAISYIIF